MMGWKFTDLELSMVVDASEKDDCLVVDVMY
jgi:hypothetical protein